ncbi:hypothetical protein LCGC14_1064100 [marine sediment metagenome]|uniref:Uncharacterized protein n=1 Tax=marine sediment metagenome TaxID=412755 RepID=A0A0F9N759_9ZZZZ
MDATKKDVFDGWTDVAKITIEFPKQEVIIRGYVKDLTRLRSTPVEGLFTTCPHDPNLGDMSLTVALIEEPTTRPMRG